MSLKKIIFLFFTLLCFSLASCGEAPSSTAAPSPTANANKETIVQAYEFIPEKSSSSNTIFSTPTASHPGLTFPSIRIKGPCQFDSPQPMQKVAFDQHNQKIAIPAQKVLVVRRSTSTVLENSTGGIDSISYYTFDAIPGPGQGTLDAGYDYAIVSSENVGKMVVAFVAEYFSKVCPDTIPYKRKYDSSLIDISKKYPFPSRFSVSAP